MKRQENQSKEGREQEDEESRKRVKKEDERKFIFIIGGSLSGIGKATLAGSIGVLIKEGGIGVQMVKLEAQLNVDAGSMDESQNGEAFVTEDGALVSNDIGNYERLLGESLSGTSYLTTGQVYSKILEKERVGAYLGQTVQVVPHVTQHVMDHLRQATTAQVVIVEVGGIVGDIENQFYYEALRQMIYLQDKPNNFCVILCAYVPELGSSEYQKTKPTQRAITDLREVGLTPDFLICRSEHPVTPQTLSKAAQYSGLPVENVFNVQNIAHRLKMPFLLEEVGLVGKVFNHLHLEKGPSQNLLDFYSKFNERLDKIESSDSSKRLKVGILGKKVKHIDSFESLYRNLEMFCNEEEMLLDLIQIEKKEDLVQVDLVIMPGGEPTTDIQDILSILKEILLSDQPFLAIGHSFFIVYLLFTSIPISSSFNSYHQLINHYFYPAVNVKGSFHTIFQDSQEDQQSLIHKIYRNEKNHMQIFKERYRFGMVLKEEFMEQRKGQVKETAHIRSQEVVVPTVVERIGSRLQMGVQFFPEMNSTYKSPSVFIRHFLLLALE